MLQDLENLENKLIDCKEEISKLKADMVNPEQIKLTKEEFLNLTNSVADKMRAGSAVEKDILARILFLNVHLDNDNRPIYLRKEPFKTLLESKKVFFGAVKRT